MNQLMLAMALSGGGAAPGTMKAIQQMRLRNYEKLCMFIKWLTTTLVYGYFWLKKHPEVFTKDGTTQDYSGEGTQSLVNALWTRQDQKDFFANMIRDGAELLMTWLKPDEHELDMWAGLIQHPTPTAQLPGLMANQQDLLNNLIAQLQQSVPASSVAAVPAGPAPMPAGWTREQYIAHYGYAPPVVAAPPVAPGRVTQINATPGRRGSEY